VPIGLAAAPDGTIYVTDTANNIPYPNRVQAFRSCSQ
jgi:hypothetical protein